MKIFARHYDGAKLVETDLSGCFDVVFGDSAVAPGAIRIRIRDGWVEVSGAHGSLEMQPPAANQVRFRTLES